MTSGRTLRNFGYACLAGLVVLAGWMNLRAREAKSLASPTRAKRENREMPVRTALVSQSTVTDVIGATVVTEASASATIQIGASREFLDTDLVATKVTVHEGQIVKPGDLIVELDSTVFAAVLLEKQEALGAAKAELARVEKSIELDKKIRELELSGAEAEITFRQADLKRRKDNLDHFDRLFKTNSANIIEYGEAIATHAEAVFRLAEAERRRQRAIDALSVGLLTDAESLANSRERVARTVFEIKVATRDLDRCKIVTPIGGVVDAVAAVSGGVLILGTQITVVQQLDPIHVRVDFPQERMRDLAIGQPAEVVLDGFPQETLKGAVVRIGAGVQPETRVLPVIIAIENKDHRIRPGISGFARISLTKSAMLLPTTALIEHGSGAMVFSIQDGHARIRPVRTSATLDEGQVEVVDGLTAGDEVVVFGTQQLSDGDPVDVHWQRWARRD